MIEAIIGGAGATLWTVVMFVIALGIIVTIHEFGHYIVARWSGIHAEAFSVGFGPVLARHVDRRGTQWQIALLPLGGYVRFLGDADAASAGPARAVDPALRRRTLDGAPLWARAATVAAGPLFNFALSILLFGLMILWQGAATEKVVVGTVDPTPPGIVNELQPGDEVTAINGRPIAGWGDLLRFADTESGPHEWQVLRDGVSVTVTGPSPQAPLVRGVAPRSPALAGGLRTGDVITGIDGQPITRFAEIGASVDAAEGQPLRFTLWREGRGSFDTTITPRQEDFPGPEGGFIKRWLIGISGGGSFFAPATRSVSPVEALSAGAAETWGIITSSLTGIRAMVLGEISRCNLGGPIAIAESTGQMAGQGIAPFIRWIAILSAAIGFLNLLPVPVLDGGHLAFYAYEAVFRRPPPAAARNWLTTIGLALVIGLMVFGLTNDIACR